MKANITIIPTTPAAKIERGNYRAAEWVGTPRHLRLKSLVPAWARPLIEEALGLGIIEVRNDAPRGGKAGEYYHIPRTISARGLKIIRNRRARQAAAAQAELEAKLSQVLPSHQVDGMALNSDIGSIRINVGRIRTELLNNFCGDGEVRVEICKIDGGANLDDYDYISRREVYAANEPLTVRRFLCPQKLRIWNSDIGNDDEYREFSGVVAFAVWAGKMKIIIDKNTNTPKPYNHKFCISWMERVVYQGGRVRWVECERLFSPANKKITCERLANGDERTWDSGGQLTTERLWNGDEREWLPNGNLIIERLHDGTRRSWFTTGGIWSEHLPNGEVRGRGGESETAKKAFAAGVEYAQKMNAEKLKA